MEVMDKLTILADAAKYDAACTSSGVVRGGKLGSIGTATNSGCCHTRGQKQPLNVVSPIKLYGQLRQLPRGEGRPGHVVGAAVDAIAGHRPPY